MDDVRFLPRVWIGRSSLMFQKVGRVYRRAKGALHPDDIEYLSIVEHEALLVEERIKNIEACKEVIAEALAPKDGA